MLQISQRSKKRKIQDQSLKSNQSIISDFTPKGYFVEYPFLMDLAIKQFIDDFQDSFVQKKDKFVLTKRFSKKNLKTLFLNYLAKTIARIHSKRVLTHPEYKNISFIVADSGIERRTNIELLEQDIDIGIDKIESVLQEIFDDWFLKKSKIETVDRTRSIICKHTYLLSGDWKKILEKKIFGKSNFTDLTEENVCIREQTSDEKIRSLSRRENDLIIKEAVEWVKKELEARI